MKFCSLETIRLDARIKDELPGLHRQMQSLQNRFERSDAPAQYSGIIHSLTAVDASVQTTLELLGRIPEGRLVVTESGIHFREDVRRMRDRGVSAFLVGEAFMRAGDPGERLRQLFGD